MISSGSTATIQPRCSHQVIMMQQMMPSDHATFALRITCDFKDSAPIVGVSLREKPCDDLDILHDPDFIVWNLAERSIHCRGEAYSKTNLECSSGCEIEVSLNMKRQTIKLCVKSITGEIDAEEIAMKQLKAVNYWPILGAISVGLKPIEFELINETATLSELHDITTSVRFTVAGGKMNVSTDGRAISRSSSMQGNSVALLNQVIREGTHYWKLRVMCDFGASIGIGLATHNFQVSEKYLRDPLKHIYHHKGLLLWRSYRGILYKHGRQQPQSIEPLGWQNNCPVIVEFILDMSKGTLEIIKNGKALGVAFMDIRGPVQPAIAFYASYEKEVQLLEYHSPSILAEIVEPDAAVHYVQSDRTTFDPKSLTGRLLLTDDGMTLFRKREQSGNAFCLLNTTLDNGSYRWSFVIQNDQGASTCIGVAREPIRLKETGNVYSSPDMYVLRSFQGMCYSEGKEITKRCSEFWLSGSLVEVSFEVHEEGGTVRYSVNGEDQGIAFSNIRLPVKPIVGFYAGMEKKITLVHYEHKTTELSISPKSAAKVFNDLNTEHKLSSKTQNPLPMCIRQSELSNYYDTCMMCGKQVDVIALPCKHSTLCAKDLVSNGTQNCLVCDEPVTGVWNILLDI